MHRSLGRTASVFSFVVFFAAGCGSTATVTGQVTYEGEPIKEGWIRFQPADGKGPDAAAPISDGRYTVANMLPGPKVVNVHATKQINFAKSTEELAKRHAENKAKGDASGLVDPADIIPNNAEGNNVTIEIAAGTHARDFALKKPAKK